jgi:hypothetical protein
MSTPHVWPYRVSTDDLVIREQYREQLRALTAGARRKLDGPWWQ